jgi:hypothetical protein
VTVRIINADEARHLLAYDPLTGELRWRKSRGRVSAGQIAGSLASNGYWDIFVLHRRYRGHRLAWLITYGVWPEYTIDHKNGNRSDNRIDNLREATITQNHANQPPRKSSRSGVRGVHFSQREQRWIAKITVSGRTKHVGQFKTRDAAAKAYAQAARVAFGEFAREEL